MRALIVHNHYRTAATSGEDVVFHAEVGLLRQAGVEVATFERSNEELRDGGAALARTFVEGVWSRRAYAALRDVLRTNRPDVAHFHNTFPQISVSAYRACMDEGVPIVQTLHNFRVSCLNGMFLRGGVPCEDCLGRTPWRGVARGCYRESRLASAAMAAMVVSGRLLRRRGLQADRYIALNDFARSRFIAAGLPAERVVVRPNALAEQPDPGDGGGGYVLFAGRLGEEKGVRALIDAWAAVPDAPLRVVGDGPLRAELEARVSRSGARVEFLGRLPHQRVIDQMKRATCLVVPSICYENMPMVIVEAYATGTPVIVSAVGSLNDLVPEPTHGLKFCPGDPEDLARTVRRALSDPAWLERTRTANRALYLTRFSPTAATASLLKIYRDVGAVGP